MIYSANITKFEIQKYNTIPYNISTKAQQLHNIISSTTKNKSADYHIYLIREQINGFPVQQEKTPIRPETFFRLIENYNVIFHFLV